jgi:pimeloyl-ACP methyl ester carboxylesterase
MQPTIVLVHGAFAEPASWDGVIDRLMSAGHPVIAAANPLRGLATDAAAVSDLVRTIDGPVLLVGHSYGGAVITNVDPEAGEIVGVAYVAALAPEPGEGVLDLANMFPGGTLGDAVKSVPRSDGTTDVYILADCFRSQFCADVPAAQAATMAAKQRPVTREALVEPSGEAALWQAVPSFFLFGELDRIIPVALQRYMAARARTHRVTEIRGASHAVPVAHAAATAHLISEAASLCVAA